MKVYLTREQHFDYNDEGYDYGNIEVLNVAYFSEEKANDFCYWQNIDFLTSQDFIEFFLWSEYHGELEKILSDYKWMEGMKNPITIDHAKELLNQRYAWFVKFTVQEAEVEDAQ